MISRRGVIGGGVVSVAAAWPLALGAQQPVPVVGFLSSTSPEAWAPYVMAFHRGLGDGGYVEHRNVVIEYRWAEGDYARLPTLAADLLRRHVAAIVAVGGSASAIAAKALTTTIPIVFSTGGDPVKLGLVTSLNRPGGNATGVTVLLGEMEGKRLGLLREVVPAAELIAVLLNPRSPIAEVELKGVQEAARAAHQQIHILNASSEQDLDAVFASLVQLRPGALLVGSDPFFNSRREQIVELTVRHAIPAMYELREFAVAGGLMSYGVDLADGYRQVGIYTARILKGDKPGDLPVVRSTKFQFVINLKAAKALGIDVPPGLSARADEVIE